MSMSDSQDPTPFERVGAVQDVTQKQLRERELSLRLITQTIPGMFWSTTPQGDVDYCNGPWLDFVAMSAEQAKGWGWTAAIYPDDRKALVECWQSCLSSGKPFDLEARMRRYDSAYRWFLFRANPLRDESGKIIKWYGTNTDIEDRKRGEEVLRATELSWRQIVDNIPGLVSTTSATGQTEFLNRQTLEFYGKTSEELKDWSQVDVVHPDDSPRVVETLRKSFETGQNIDLEVRLRRADGVYRWFQVRAVPARNAEGKITDWYVLHTDIDDRKRAEEKLRATEYSLRQTVDSIPGFVWQLSAAGDVEVANRQLLAYFGRDVEDIKNWETSGILHPEDLPHAIEVTRHSFATGQPYEIEIRARRFDGVYRWFQVRGHPEYDAEGRILRWYSLSTDIDDRKRAEEKLRQSEADFRTITNNIPGFVCTASPTGEAEFFNHQILEYYGKTSAELKDNRWALTDVVHPDDLPRVIEAWKKSIETGQIYDIEHRCRRADGVYRWFQVRGLPMRNAEDTITAWYLLLTDIDDRKRAEQELQKREKELLTITDSIANPIAVLAPDGAMLYANRVALNHSGLSLSEAQSGFYLRCCHPDDIERAQHERLKGLREGVPFELEARFIKYGEYRWHLSLYNPLKDERGHILRWYVTATDIDERKKAEDQLRNENLVLREEIDRSSMFEEIVGSSKPVRQVLKHVEKVASSDSTVLILGETGTGKELIARALHRRSKRASRVFIRVNCAAIPQSLIASELFGHEKGAFTGALQRRLGRFEAANGGTLFLDEIGELPMETQIALLRVLQEKEFERVGSNHPISVDVRVIAATNRDLPAAVAAGTFRQDLFFRLNVFPIAVPSLCERVDDIPLLVEYFVGRFAKEAGKSIRHVSKDTLELLKSYHWPGNIRELQNVVERAVILSESDTFIVDESWLQSESAESSPKRGLSALEDHEVEMIEAALAQTHGRISGPSGAAAKLGIPRQTLESKIRRLGIDKYGQKRPSA